jgi:type II secretory pathway pseudopilin PulG
MRRGKESGYALLLVFLMAAVVAISLYSEIPRVAFQSQRQKEQLLMERGLQYQRAIQVFQQVNKGQWPRNLDDIETFNNRHFLRHKYVDPMTGKQEWRLIHIQGGVLTDSLVTKKPADKQSTGTESNYISAYAGVGQTAVGVQVQRPQDRRRASEGGAGGGAESQLPMMPGAATDPSAQPPGAQPASEPPAPGATPGNPPYPVAGVPAQGALGMPGMPGMPGSTPQGPAPTDTSGSYVSSSPGVGAQMPTQSGPGQPVPGGMPGLPGQPGYPNPQMPGANGQGSNPVTNLINGLLTRPNPQLASGGLSSGNPSGAMGGGVAGVASNADQEGVMVYNDRTDYKEWEFVFDPSKVTPIAASGGGPGGTPVNQMGPQQGQMPGGRQAPGGMPGGMGLQGGQQGSQMGPGMPGNGAAGGTPNGPAGMQTAGGSPGLPPGFRMGRP